MNPKKISKVMVEAWSLEPDHLSWNAVPVFICDIILNNLLHYSVSPFPHQVVVRLTNEVVYEILRIVPGTYIL